MPLIILALGIVLLFALIVWAKMNSFISLIIVSLVVGLAEGLPLLKVVGSIENGVGGTLGHLALVIAFGSMIGKLMVDSGGAQQIATTLIRKFGRKNIKWAVCLTGFIVGIALFFEVGFVLMIPLVFTIAATANVPLLEVGIPMVIALGAAHGFLPPHPGPTAIAAIFNADLGMTLVYGIIIAIPTIILGGPVFYKTTTDLKPVISKELFDSDKIFKKEEMPSFTLSLITALIPVVLMAAAAIIKMTLAKNSPVYMFFEFIGNADIAMLIALLVAIYTFGMGRGKKLSELMDGMSKAVMPVAMILLIVGGGGAFKQVLVDSGVSNYLVTLMAGCTLSPLFLGWLIASVLRIAVGSATVAALTAGGIVAPLIAVSGVSPELMVLAIGGGSMNAGPPNDPSFWMFKEYFNLSVKETLRTWSIMMTIIAFVGLAGVMIIDAIIR